MTRAAAGVAAVFLQPGEVAFATAPTVITTVLGSCVAVTMFDPLTRVAAICHGQLPYARPDTVHDDYRFVDLAIRRLAEEFDRLGVPRRRVAVKVFGGADVLLAGRSTADHPSVGAQNSESALATLASAHFLVATTVLGGVRGIKLHFRSWSGEVLVKRVARGLRVEPGMAGRRTRPLRSGGS